MGVMIKVTDETGTTPYSNRFFPTVSRCWQPAEGTHPARPATPLLTPNILQHPASVQTQKLTYSIWLTM